MLVLKSILYIVITAEILIAQPFSLNSILNLYLAIWFILVIRCLVFKKPFRIYYSLLPFSLFFISLIFYSKTTSYGYQQLSLILSYLSIFILSQNLISKHEIKNLIHILGALVIIYTLIEALWILPYLRQIFPSSSLKNMHHLKYIISKQRTTAFFLTPNNLGIFLLFTLYALWECKSKFWKYAISVVIFSCILTTKSIGVWICLAGAILIVSYKTINKKYIWGGLIIIFCFLTTVIWLRRDLLFNPYNLYFNPFYQRAKMWERTLILISHRPITGYGLGSFSLWYNQGLPHYLNQEIYAHNFLLQLWFESGLCGFLWAIIFYLFSLQMIWKKLNDEPFLSLCCLTFLIHNLFDASFYLPKVGIFFWIFLALLLRPAHRHNI